MNSLEDSRMLEEYEILKEVLYTTTVNNMSYTKVKIALLFKNHWFFTN